MKGIEMQIIQLISCHVQCKTILTFYNSTILNTHENYYDCFDNKETKQSKTKTKHVRGEDYC